MELLQQESDAPLRFEGAGTVGGSNDGDLTLKLFHAHEIPIQVMLDSSSLLSGRSIPSSKLYHLSATDADGTVWSSDGLYPRFNSTPWGSVIEARLAEITCTMHRPNASEHPKVTVLTPAPLHFAHTDSVERVFVGGWGFPVSDHAQCASWADMDGRITLVQEPEFLLAQWDVQEGLPTDAATKFARALEFAFCSACDWLVAIEEAGHEARVRVRPYSSISRTRSRLPPVPAHQEESIDDALTLISLHLLRSGAEPWPKLPPLVAETRRVVAAADSPLEIRALSWCVAVEALLQEEFEGVKPADFDHTTAQAAKAIALIQESDLTESFKARAVGAISGLRHVRAKDKLKLLVESAVVPRGLVEAWDRLRQPAWPAPLRRSR